MSLRMIVEVTQEDIDNGQRAVPSACPIARAIRKNFMGATVNRTNVKLDGWGKSTELPQIAKNFVNDFDNGKPVRPFDFELDLGDFRVI